MKPNAEQVAWTTAIGFSEDSPAHEVRRHIRYPLRAPATFLWVGRDGIQREAKGNTRDLSEGGAYVTTRTYLPVGVEMTLSVRFPFLTDFAQSHRIVMSGQVVRIDVPLNPRSNWGFAFSSTRAILEETDDFDGGPQQDG